MTFLERFWSLARADAHAVLDSLEDRTLLLRQCLRDAELELERKRARCAELDAALKREACRERQICDTLEALDADVRLALERNEETLARFSIRRLLALRKQAERSRVLAHAARAERDQLSDKLCAQQSELETLRQRVRLAVEQDRTARACVSPASGALDPDAVLDEEVELELLRRRTAPAESQA